MVVHALRRKRIVAIALDLVTQRADHLRMAEIAPLAHIDVTSGKLKRGVGPHALHFLDRTLEIKQRPDLDHAADRDHEQNADDKQDRVLLDDLMFGKDRHDTPFHSAGWSAILGVTSSVTP